MNTTVGRLLEEATGHLAGLEEAPREAQVLLGHALRVSRAWLSAHREDRVAAGTADRFRELVQRRRAGEPIAYLVGRREFYGLELQVTPAVLIPRPDTETLVDAALQKIAPDARIEVLDLGTGSGCVAIAIAHERRAAQVTAVDNSASALGVAQENAKSLGERVEFILSDWFEGLQGRSFDLIVANPPYVAAGDSHLAHGDLRFEPSAALVAGTDGLADIRRIVRDAAFHVREGGWLMFEHGHDQAASSIDLMRNAGFSEIFSRTDLAGVPRVAGGRLLTSKSPSR